MLSANHRAPFSHVTKNEFRRRKNKKEPKIKFISLHPNFSHYFLFNICFCVFLIKIHVIRQNMPQISKWITFPNSHNNSTKNLEIYVVPDNFFPVRKPAQVKTLLLTKLKCWWEIFFLSSMDVLNTLQKIYWKMVSCFHCSHQPTNGNLRPEVNFFY